MSSGTTLKRKMRELDAARAQYNPLRSLTMQRAVSQLELGERGQYLQLQLTFRMIEKRDAVLRALIRRRAAALLKLDWNIKQVPEDELPKGTTAKMAESQALALREVYDRIDNLKDAIKALALAEFRGYTHLVKESNKTATSEPEAIDHLLHVEQWYWTRDGMLGEWMFDPQLRGTHTSAEDVPAEFLISREVNDPVDEIALICYLRKNLSQKDWDGFVEVFGIPDIFFIMPQGMTADQQAQWLATAEQLAGDGRGAIPNGGDVKAVGGDVRGSNPFSDHLKYQDTMLVLAGTGGKLTMLSEATGIGGGATDAHEDAFNDLAEAEAAEISEIFRQSIDAPLLNKKFAGQPTLAYFEIAAKDEEDIASLVDNAQKLKQAGIDFDVDDLAERTGYSLSKSSESLPPAGPDTAAGGETVLPNRSILKPWTWLNLRPAISNRQTEDPVADLKKNARAGIAQAIALDLRPIAASLADLLDDTDDDALEAALTDWRENTLPDLTARVLKDPAASEAYADALTASLLNGYFSEEDGNA